MIVTNIIHPARAIAEEQPPWGAIELHKPMWHEAGHAVVARLTGFPVAWVSVDQNLIRTDPLAIKNECNNNPAACMTISMDQLNAIPKRRSALNKEAKATVIGYCMHVLAGPFVEYRVDPDNFNADLSANDFGQVMQIVSLVEPKKAARKKLFVTARRRLNKVLDQNWEMISRVAYALDQRQTLLGTELDDIMVSDPVKVAA